jgi:hypothetical protein
MPPDYVPPPGITAPTGGCPATGWRAIFDYVKRDEIRIERKRKRLE